MVKYSTFSCLVANMATFISYRTRHLQPDEALIASRHWGLSLAMLVMPSTTNFERTMSATKAWL
jgi:hypothetical protein